MTGHTEIVHPPLKVALVRGQRVRTPHGDGVIRGFPIPRRIWRREKGRVSVLLNDGLFGSYFAEQISVIEDGTAG